MTGRAAGLQIDVVIEAAPWNSGSEATVRRAIAAAAPAGLACAELSVVLTDDASIRALNKQWRDRDEATNVLSFPAPDASSGHRSEAPVLLGDIVIAFETTAREAEAESKPFAHHLSHLALHGFLHLLGYDHESEAEAETMERLERDILARLAMPDPYQARDTEA